MFLPHLLMVLLLLLCGVVCAAVQTADDMPVWMQVLRSHHDHMCLMDQEQQAVGTVL
jgi:hypothetical protein